MTFNSKPEVSPVRIELTNNGLLVVVAITPLEVVEVLALILSMKMVMVLFK